MNSDPDFCHKRALANKYHSLEISLTKMRWNVEAGSVLSGYQQAATRITAPIGGLKMARWAKVVLGNDEQLSSNLPLMDTKNKVVDRDNHVQGNK